MGHMQNRFGLAERQSFGETSFFFKRTNSSASHFCHVEICFFHFSSRSALKSPFDDFSTSALTHWHAERRRKPSAFRNGLWVCVCAAASGLLLQLSKLHCSALIKINTDTVCMYTRPGSSQIYFRNIIWGATRTRSLFPPVIYPRAKFLYELRRQAGRRAGDIIIIFHV